jgi:hypothetical protein
MATVIKVSAFRWVPSFAQGLVCDFRVRHPGPVRQQKEENST